jgi:hypothetical protein
MNCAGHRNVLLVADAYYASGKFIHQLLANGHQLVTRAARATLRDGHYELSTIQRIRAMSNFARRMWRSAASHFSTARWHHR